MLSGQKDLLGLTEFLVESSSVALFFLSGYWLEIIFSDWKTCSVSPQGLTDLSSHQQWPGKRKTLLLLAENKKKKILF